MKRFESLQPLSRQHHSGLILAQLLKKGAPVYKGLPTTVQDKWKFAQQFYMNKLLPHMQLEELMIQKFLKGINNEMDQLANVLMEEHVIINQLFTSLNTINVKEADLHALGIFLEQHIRKEEREFFPLIQNKCSPAILDSIGTLLTTNRTS